jgi:hypothetical protein
VINKAQVAQKNIERKYDMAQKKEKESSPDITPHMDNPTPEFAERLKAINREHENAIKQLNADKAQYFAKKDLEKWKKLTELKAQFADTLDRNNVSGWNLKRLSNMQDYDSYQHPKTPQLKANSDKEKWVVDFINSGGKIETLITTAEKSQVKTWNNITGKTKRDKVKAQAQKEAEKKRRAAEKSKGKKIGVKAKSSTSNASRLGL